MPIKHSKQNWTIGQTVKVGFLSLKVIEFTPTPGDHRPDTYTLVGTKGARYIFTPHYGLERIAGVYVETAQVETVSNTHCPVPVATTGGRYFRVGE